jgi:hypothetical protein
MFKYPCIRESDGEYKIMANIKDRKIKAITPTGGIWTLSA